MELLNKQQNIINYIKTEYKNKLSEFYGAETDVDAYISDFIDLDKYKKNTQVFFDWSNYQFTELSLDSKLEEVELHIYITFRGDRADVLHNNMMNYASVMYATIGQSHGFNNEVDIAEVTAIDFFEAAEAEKNIKVADITVSMRDEVVNTI